MASAASVKKERDRERETLTSLGFYGSVNDDIWAGLQFILTMFVKESLDDEMKS